jgi:hypothetical protein
MDEVRKKVDACLVKLITKLDAEFDTLTHTQRMTMAKQIDMLIRLRLTTQSHPNGRQTGDDGTTHSNGVASQENRYVGEKD